MGIIKNEKYKGDIRQGKTFTLDPISKRRLDNFGEEDQCYIRNHHEPIIDEEVFESAQRIIHAEQKVERRLRGKEKNTAVNMLLAPCLNVTFEAVIFLAAVGILGATITNRYGNVLQYEERKEILS